MAPDTTPAERDIVEIARAQAASGAVLPEHDIMNAMADEILRLRTPPPLSDEGLVEAIAADLEKMEDRADHAAFTPNSIDYASAALASPALNAWVEGRVEDLVAALEPFAALAPYIPENYHFPMVQIGLPGEPPVPTDAFRKAQEAIRARTPSSPRDGWQDISTAPRDGTIIMVWCPDLAGERMPRVVHWSDAHPRFTWADPDGEGGSIAEDQPTHWMPLPSPPSSPRDDVDAGSLSNSPAALRAQEKE